MPIYQLTKALLFPSPTEASDDGLLAVGGDYRPERLLLAYLNGIFPWPADQMPHLWFSPDPRFVLVPRQIHVGRTLNKRIRNANYEVRADTSFAEVMQACAGQARPGQKGTWITQELVDGFAALHRLGLAHSVEVWTTNEELVGGLYGISIGGVFFGESMFSEDSDASKIALVTLAGQLIEWTSTSSTARSRPII